MEVQQACWFRLLLGCCLIVCASEEPEFSLDGIEDALAVNRFRFRSRPRQASLPYKQHPPMTFQRARVHQRRRVTWSFYSCTNVCTSGEIRGACDHRGEKQRSCGPPESDGRGVCTQMDSSARSQDSASSRPSSSSSARTQPPPTSPGSRTCWICRDQQYPSRSLRRLHMAV